jgi:hypothetical protein
MQVVTNVPGTNSNSKAKATDFVCLSSPPYLTPRLSPLLISALITNTPQPLTAKVAATQTCTGTVGGMEGVCMVRCNNAARAGPFGGCVPVQMASTAGNATATAAKMARSFQA